MPSKFLNISTDTTLGGSSASDDTVSSQKAIKAYVDSQTGTAPAFANITGQPTDNANLATALNAKYDASNPNGYTSNVGTVTSVNNVSPVSGNVTLSIPTVTDTYSATSSNAMSGKAVASALSSYVPTSRTINSKALSSNITLSASDVGAVATNTTITGSTKCKITYDSKGLVTGGADLSASDIPDLSSTYQTKLSSSNKLSTDYISGLATVATSGKSSDLNNDAGFITGITSGDVTTALGYTPYNSTNPSGYITGITSSDVTTALGYTPYNSSNPSGYQANVIETVKVNGTALTPSSKAVDVTVPTETTVSGWGFTKNAGTVTSVNNVSPVSGNVTLSIPTVTDTYSATSSNAMSGKAVASAISGKQDTLVSGTSIKTVNSTSLLGSGNIAVQSVIDANNKLDYAYLSNTPTIPTVNNATLTITQGGTTKGTFTANASSNVTIDLDAGGGSGANTDLSNLTATGEAHFVKPSELATCHVVVETWHSGTEWYRVYDDGWCEQGGHFGTLSQSLQTVYFLKQFTDTNYNIQVSFATTVAPYTSSASVNYYEASNKTASSFTIYGHGNANLADKDWQACGYIS